MHIPKGVNKNSTDSEIIAAIQLAGDLRLRWRRRDWPEPGAKNQKAWVKPGDIGYSSHDSPFLLKRLRKMVDAGLLEETCFNTVRVRRRSPRMGESPYLIKDGMPRFRVIMP